MLRTSAFAAFCLLAAPAAAQTFAAPASPDGVPELARALLAGAHDLPADDRFRAEIAAGRYPEAAKTLNGLRMQDDASPRVRAIAVRYDIYIEARRAGGIFADAYVRAFRARLAGLDDRTAAGVIGRLGFTGSARALAGDLDKAKAAKSVVLADATALVRDYVDATMERETAPFAATLTAEDDARRYVIRKDVQVSSFDGTLICALVARPIHGPAHLPALLQFTIYNEPAWLMNDARRAAANGYVGVMALTRGKGCGTGTIVPYEHDGADADAVIDWIARQPWSDGQVGMYGGSYSGFTPWAAAKHKPAALKAIMVGAPAAPGIDAPMEGNVTWNFLYPWPFYTTDNKILDDATYGDNARWAKLNHDWYVSGRAYRDLDKVDGTPNPVFDRWLEHEDYDAYWQALIPYGHEFAGIDIPVLETAGYYYGGPGAAWYYFGQHVKFRPDADHTLVLGPYDHFMAQRGTLGIDGDPVDVGGYTLDPAARIDLIELRYRWFDHVLKGAPKPALLADRVNYEVPGADIWKHAHSLEAMAVGKFRCVLSAIHDGKVYRLVDAPSGDTLTLQVDYKDRSDADAQTPGGGVLDKDLDVTNGLEFAAAPFDQPREFSGLFSGHLRFKTNKKDFDFQISLYAQLADGRYMQLSSYWSRASYVADLSRRHLLAPGVAQNLDFTANRPMSFLFPKGSRLVVVLQAIKDPGRQIDYGSGKKVNAETIADAYEPLKIEWSTASFIDVPIGRR